MVIRDSNSKIIAAAVKISQLWMDVAYAEAEAMEWGLMATKEVAVSHMIMETACQELADLVSNNKRSRTEFFRAISEIQNQSKLFKKVRFQSKLFQKDFSTSQYYVISMLMF